MPLGTMHRPATRGKAGTTCGTTVCWRSPYPKDYGGLGADMLTYIMAIESLAYGCTNSTMTLHMHSIVQQVINAIATPEQKEVFYRDVVEDGRVFGSWGSEPESRGGTRAGKRTVIAPIEGGYVVNGRKHFCSMAGAAHRCMIHCAMRGYEGVDAFSVGANAQRHSRNQYRR